MRASHAISYSSFSTVSKSESCAALLAKERDVMTFGVS